MSHYIHCSSNQSQRATSFKGSIARAVYIVTGDYADQWSIYSYSDTIAVVFLLLTIIVFESRSVFVILARDE